MSAQRLDERLLARLHERATAARWSVSREQLQASLLASLEKAHAGQTPSPRDIERYLSSLHLADLALACACANGHEEAWRHFITELRPVLYRSADALDPTGGAREIADSLYAELYGIDARGGARRSLLTYFHGRSSLATWLRALLAQRHVDAIRSRRRVDPLPEDDEALPAPAAARDPDCVRLVPIAREALARAVASLEPSDRLRLGCYYAQQLTLAEIGRMFGEHEATASRHLTRIRRRIRLHVEASLRDEARLSDAEVTRCFECLVQDSGPLDLRDLLGASSGRPIVLRED